MRIAWIGPLDNNGGVPAMGRTLLLGLLAQGIEVDLFSLSTQEHVRAKLGTHENLKFIPVPHWWEYGHWYSRSGFVSFLTNFYARAQSHRKLCELVYEHHEARPYDCVTQFSQMELLRLEKYLDRLPPIVVYTCVHAAGEYEWHAKESAYARASEGNLRHYIVRLFLLYRTHVQRRQAKLPAMLIGMSKRFNELIVRDYGVPANQLRVLYHPIDPAPPAVDLPIENRKVRVVFAGRISVRKGVEMAIELSKRLDDLADQVEIEIIGGHTQWSDYRKHLTELNPRIAKYAGAYNNPELLDTFAKSDVLITPSHYEPGGLVVGEAASRGMCIVASDEVGSAEPLSGDFILKFKAGDMDAFERCTREMIQRVKSNRPALAAAARKAVNEEFAPEKISSRLLELLKEAAAMKR